jgi:hypothetical protein
MPVATLPSIARVSENTVSTASESPSVPITSAIPALTGSRLGPSPSRRVIGPGSAIATPSAMIARPIPIPIISKPRRAGFVCANAVRWRTCSEIHHASSRIPPPSAMRVRASWRRRANTIGKDIDIRR